MTFREKLADWISGGALTDARDEARLLDQLFSEAASREYDMQDALECIAAMETPGANATVRRMAKVAREALGERG